MSPTLIKKTMACTLLLACITIAFFSCQKELSGENNGAPDQPADLTTRVTISTASGFITDENNTPVKGAVVQLGTSRIISDKFGHFEFTNIEVAKNAAFISVISPGYFKGIRTFTAKSGKGFFTRIKLIQKKINGNFNAATGGNVTLSNGLIIALPANGVVNAATGAAYSGTVGVAAFHINPEAADLNEIMPGDQRGINKSGALKLLQTYGIAAVELTGSGGELLQIATGKKATLTIPIPASLSAKAPASIPLWYLDETNGLWKEEGSAVKSGNNYVGDAGHFSFWDLNTPANYVNVDGWIVDNNGHPLPNVWVEIHPSNSAAFTGRFGYTDATGYVSGPVPDNAQLMMDVYVTHTIICTPAYTQSFTTSNVDMPLGNAGIVMVTPNASWATVEGTIKDCNNNILINNYVIAKFDNYFYWIPSDNTGHFYFYKDLCNTNSKSLSLQACDFSTRQEGPVSTYTIFSGNNNVGDIIACGQSFQEFMDYTINGTPYFISYLPGYVSHSISQTFGIYNNPVARVTAFTAPASNTQLNSDLIYAENGIGLNSNQDIKKFMSSIVLPDTMMVTTPLTVNITEYGNVGQYISGNFSGTLTGRAPTNTPYVVTCSFRVKRTQ